MLSFISKDIGITTGILKMYLIQALFIHEGKRVKKIGIHNLWCQKQFSFLTGFYYRCESRNAALQGNSLCPDTLLSFSPLVERCH